MHKNYTKRLNLRELGGIPFSDGKGVVPEGLFWRSGKLGVLTKAECEMLCRQRDIKCVIDLRTSVEVSEYPDPLPDCIEYIHIPLLKDSSIGITHETSSDPMTIVRRLRKNPEELLRMIPDFKFIYRSMVTDEYSRSQVAKAVAKLRENASSGRATLFHCTAGKDRTGIVAMALLKSYDVGDDAIIKDYLQTNRNSFCHTVRKSLGIALMTRNLHLARIAYNGFMAHREHIEAAMNEYSV